MTQVTPRSAAAKAAAKAVLEHVRSAHEELCKADDLCDAAVMECGGDIAATVNCLMCDVDDLVFELERTIGEARQ